MADILPGIPTSHGDEAEHRRLLATLANLLRDRSIRAALGISLKNLVINGGADVMQVGAYTLVKDVYGHGPDMFMGMATGTAVSAGTFSRTTGVVGTTDQYA